MGAAGSKQAKKMLDKQPLENKSKSESRESLTFDRFAYLNESMYAGPDSDSAEDGGDGHMAGVQVHVGGDGVHVGGASATANASANAKASADTTDSDEHEEDYMTFVRVSN